MGANKTVHPFQILYEDNHLIVVDKPAGWIVQGAQPDQRSLLEEARQYIKAKYHKPGDVYLGVVSRLDAAVTGVVPFARTSKAAARLSEQFRERAAQKSYVALVEGVPQSRVGRLEHDLLRPPDETVTRVARPGDRNTLHAILQYDLVRSEAGMSLLQIELVTGRKHQIRCQLAAMGWPIAGDRLYGSRRGFPHGIALHCRQLVLLHPTTKQKIEIDAPLPVYWPAWARQNYLR
ncbi:MAG: RluA family pseudouridine synthase [Planctomycetes bacterium]|nr:RluA family pseudouridine synthase [Planctomycetota bacterium]